MRWRMAALTAALGACALTSKSKPLEIEYYAPPVAETAEASAARQTRDARIRLRRVEGGSHLRSRIAYRTSDVQLNFYDGRRWTEPPDVYVRRALEQTLYERGVLVTGGVAIDLEVEVLAFEQLEAERAGRVALRYRLVDRREVIAEDEVDVSRPASGDFTSLVSAIGEALDAACEQLVTDVIDRLESR